MVLLHEVLGDAEGFEALAPVGLLEETALVAVHVGHDQEGVGQCGLARLHRGRTIALECRRQSAPPVRGSRSDSRSGSCAALSTRRSAASVAACVLSSVPLAA